MPAAYTLIAESEPNIGTEILIPVNNPLERIMKEIRRRTLVVGAFPDGQSCLNLAAARLRHIAGSQWSTRKYMNMAPLYAEQTSTHVCGTARSSSAFLERFPDVRRCGRMSGLFARQLPLASMSSMKLVAESEPCAWVARRGFRPVLLRDVVPLVHHSCSALCTCRLSPVSWELQQCLQPGTAAANVVPGAR